MFIEIYMDLSFNGWTKEWIDRLTGTYEKDIYIQFIILNNCDRWWQQKWIYKWCISHSKLSMSKKAVLITDKNLATLTSYAV